MRARVWNVINFQATGPEWFQSHNTRSVEEISLQPYNLCQRWRETQSITTIKFAQDLHVDICVCGFRDIMVHHDERNTEYAYCCVLSPWKGKWNRKLSSHSRLSTPDINAVHIDSKGRWCPLSGGKALAPRSLLVIAVWFITVILFESVGRNVYSTLFREPTICTWRGRISAHHGVSFGVDDKLQDSNSQWPYVYKKALIWRQNVLVEIRLIQI